MMSATRRFNRIDVPQILEQEKEPLTEIRARPGQLKEGGGLEVPVPFLPSVLMGLSPGEGRRSKCERGPGFDGLVRFGR